MTFRSDTDLKISVGRAGEKFGPAVVRPDAEPIWSIPISGKEFDNYVVFHDDLVIIHREYKEIIAVKAESGEQVWVIEDPAFKPQMKANSFYWPTSVSCSQGQILIWNGTFFHVLDARNGDVLIDAPDADRSKLPDAFNYKQYGDWLRKHTGDEWVHRATGESQSTVPQVFSGFQEHGYRVTGLAEHFFFDGYLADWEGELKEGGKRTLVCRDTKTWQIRWKRDISTGDLGVDPADKRGRVEPPKLIFQLRHAMVVSSGSYVRGPQGNFAIIDLMSGKLVEKGHTGEWLPVELATGRLLHPPIDARDLVLIHQTEVCPFELVVPVRYCRT